MIKIKRVYESSSMEDTAEFAYQMAADAQPGQVYALIGDLGVGKTVFTKGFARGLGIDEPVSSPTFTILQKMEEVGFDDYIYGDGVCLIEWANRIEEILPENTIFIIIEKDLEKGLDYRKITEGYLTEGYLA